MFKLQTYILQVLLLLCWTATAYRPLPKPALDKLTSLSVDERLQVNGSLLKPLLVPRVAGTEGNLNVRNFIKAHFEKLKWQVEEDKFTADTPHGSTEFSNLIVTKNPQYSSRFVLAAHYDSKHYEHFEFIGATDSAVPCAILMDVAETLDSYMDSVGRKTALQMIFFDGEEAFKDWTATDSIYGARHLAEKWEQQIVPTGKYHTSKQSNMLDSIEVMVLLDLLGTSNIKVYNFFRSTSWLFDHMNGLEQRLVSSGNWKHDGDDLDEPDLTFDTQGVNMFHGMIEDDHIPFVRRGVNVFHIIPYPFPSVWHNVRDNGDAIDPLAVQNLAILFRCFTAEYLEIDVLGHQEL